MKNYENTVFHPFRERESGLQSAARLISSFHERRPLDEVNEKALRCYDLLIEILENSSTAKKISLMLHIPEIAVQGHAEAIIDLLLFNKKNNPFISLGLQRLAPLPEIKKRWKRLIMLYHPDKNLNQKSYEEKTKKINEAYVKITTMKERTISPEPMKQAIRFSAHKDAIRHFGYLKHLPTLIIIGVIVMALLTILLFIVYRSRAHTDGHPYEVIQVHSGAGGEANDG